MEASILTTVLLPLSLFVIMLGMGMSLVVADFKRVAKYPKATIIGLVNQLVLLPLVAFLLTQIIAMPPELAIGLMLISACPGGVTSNLICHVARGDTALSISLTAISSLITLATIPLIMGFSFRYFHDTGKLIDIDEIGMLLQIFVIVILPVGLGMFIRAKRSDFALRMDRPVRIFSTILFILILLSIILAERENIVDYFMQIGIATIALNLITIGLGFLTAKVFRLSLKQSITIAIESGIQNGTLAIVIATSVLQNTAYSVPAAVYGVLMFLTGGFIMYYFGHRKSLAEE